MIWKLPPNFWFLLLICLNALQPICLFMFVWLHLTWTFFISLKHTDTQLQQWCFFLLIMKTLDVSYPVELEYAQLNVLLCQSEIPVLQQDLDRHSVFWGETEKGHIFGEKTAAERLLLSSFLQCVMESGFFCFILGSCFAIYSFHIITSHQGTFLETFSCSGMFSYTQNSNQPQWPVTNGEDKSWSP